MLKIELTQGRFAIIDKEDIDIVSKYKWFFTKNGYAMNKSGKKSIYMHRLILGVQNGLVTDHINGNKLDNRRCNLRQCTQAQNLMNRCGVKGRSLPKGVRKAKNRYQARIGINGKSVYLGSYTVIADAVAAYNKASKQLHNNFGKLSND
jgi:hypothetical protein